MILARDATAPSPALLEIVNLRRRYNAFAPNCGRKLLFEMTVPSGPRSEATPLAQPGPDEDVAHQRAP